MHILILKKERGTYRLKYAWKSSSFPKQIVAIAIIDRLVLASF